MKSSAGAVVLFDGVCNFCNSTIQFVLRKDRKNYFRFAALQSDPGQQLLTDYNLPTSGFDTFILLENGKVYTRSTAALRLVRKLSGAWPLLFFLIIVPRFIRDFFYSLIAKNRYRWFGKKDQCMIPTAEMRSKFL